MAESGNTYIERLCDALADTLTHAAAGTKDRLAGYVGNFDFWVAEAEHCLALVRGYDERFKRFRAAQEIVAAGGAIAWDERDRWVPPPTKVEHGSTHVERKAARGRVVAAMAKFLNRCKKDGLITEAMRSAAAAKIS